jgi:hypothetical protein
MIGADLALYEMVVVVDRGWLVREKESRGILYIFSLKNCIPQLSPAKL